MKVAALTLLAAGSAAAFAPAQPSRPSTSLSMANDGMSRDAPLLPRLKLLDGLLAGDAGLEIGGAGGAAVVRMRRRRSIVLSIADGLAELANGVGDLGFDPPVLGGGGEAAVAKMRMRRSIVFSIADGLAELANGEAKKEKVKDTLGDSEFDPLKLMPANTEGTSAMQTKEIKYSRLALMAMLGYVVQEALYRIPAIDEITLSSKSLL